MRVSDQHFRRLYAPEAGSSEYFNAASVIIEPVGYEEHAYSHLMEIRIQLPRLVLMSKMDDYQWAARGADSSPRPLPRLDSHLQRR